MKFSGLLVGALALVAPVADAYPWLAPRASDADTYKSIGDFLKGFTVPNGQLANLTAQIKAAQAQVGDTGAPISSRIRLPWYKIDDAAIYNAFGIKREPDAEDHKTKRGLVDVWGVAEDEDHPYIPYDPSNPDHATWQRGPCPGLNTAANHGYIPRDGIVSPADLFIGMYKALSLAPDLCALLAFAGFVWKGDLLRMKMSIGGNKDVHGNVIINGPGISEHGFLEGDASITREDAALGDQVRVNMGRYERFRGYCAAQSQFDVTIKSLSQARKQAYDDCRNNNPKCDMNILRLIVAYAESGFGHEALRGSSRVFTEEMLHSWFIQERFPPGWRRRFTPITAAEMGAWGAAVWAAAPVSPGISLGGFFVPTPTISNFIRLTDLIGKGMGFSLLQGSVCSIGGMVMGFIPSNILGGISGLGVPGFKSIIC